VLSYAVVIGSLSVTTSVLHAGSARSRVVAAAALRTPPTVRATTSTPTTSGSTAGSLGAGQARWVIDENAKPGTSAWHLGAATRPGSIEGFADRVSAVAGERVQLFVSTTEPVFRVEAYRMGFYQGLGARRVWTSGPIPGVKQSPPARDPATNMVEARWSKSAAIDVDANWPPGDYLLKLVAGDIAQRYVPLAIRDDNSTAAFVVQNGVTSWQAYNDWGGYNLYEGGTGRTSGERRSRVVSFDRPQIRGDGASDFVGLELPLVSMVESLGLDVTYWTDVDLHARPQLLMNHRALLSLGHDEYWSRAMRDGAENARDQGVNLAFLGANAVFRQIRFEPSALGANRHQVAYKSATADPLRRSNPAEVTVNWRQPPVSRPESSLIGQQYECNPVRADMVIADGSAWVFSGTGLKTGDKLFGTIGEEYDRYNPNDPGPKDVQLLAHSPVRCHGRASYSDMTYYSAPSGAGVFASGTNWWVTKLVPPCPAGGCPHDPTVIRITRNLLAGFGAGPAGRSHPSVSNYASVTRGARG
jgi:hypothetical protein